MLFFRKPFFIISLFYLSAIEIQAGDTNRSIPSTQNVDGVFEPWFTGPLIAAAAHTVPANHTLWEPYLFVTDVFAEYDNHWQSRSIPNTIIVDPLVIIQYGITDSFGIGINTNLPSTFREHAHDTRMSDFNFSLSFQLLEDKQGSWRPDLKLDLIERFPTGHYQHLNPSKHGTDSTGFGVYRTSIALDSQKLFVFRAHLLRVRWNFEYSFSPPVHVRGFNTYGGGYGTNGKVKLGDRFFSVLAFEYTFTQNWIGALDIVYDMITKISFSGKAGVTQFGTPAHMTSPTKKQFSLAPAIEYAFNQNVGIIAGPWFSIAGKNSPRFVSWVIAINYYH